VVVLPSNVSGVLVRSLGLLIRVGEIHRRGECNNYSRSPLCCFYDMCIWCKFSHLVVGENTQGRENYTTLVLPSVSGVHMFCGSFDDWLRCRGDTQER